VSLVAVEDVEFWFFILGNSFFFSLELFGVVFSFSLNCFFGGFSITGYFFSSSFFITSGFISSGGGSLLVKHNFSMS